MSSYRGADEQVQVQDAEQVPGGEKEVSEALEIRQNKTRPVLCSVVLQLSTSTDQSDLVGSVGYRWAGTGPWLGHWAGAGPWTARSSGTGPWWQR